MHFDRDRLGARSVWAWRAFAVLALLALGLSLNFFLGGRPAFGMAWIVITAAWGGLAGRLWHAHRQA